MRIVGGIHGGRRLRAPSGQATRPTTERVREALFNILRHGGGDILRHGDGERPAPEGMRVLDLFAGSGALGFEALSHGAQHVTFVEKNRQAADLIAENARTLGAEDAITILCQDATGLKRTAGPFDLVLMDAPYGQGLSEAALSALTKHGWLSPDVQLVVELGAGETFQAPSEYSEQQRRQYGAAQLVFLRVEPAKKT